MEQLGDRRGEVAHGDFAGAGVEQARGGVVLDQAAVEVGEVVDVDGGPAVEAGTDVARASQGRGDLDGEGYLKAAAAAVDRRAAVG